MLCLPVFLLHTENLVWPGLVRPHGIFSQEVKTSDRMKTEQRGMLIAAAFSCTPQQINRHGEKATINRTQGRQLAGGHFMSENLSPLICCPV